MIFEKPEAERRVMAVTLASIKILLLEQGSMSATSNNRILGGGRGEAAPGRSDDTCPLTCTKPSGEFFVVSKCFS